MHKVLIFETGQVAVFNDFNEQVADLQKPWFTMLLEFLQSKGVKPEECSFEAGRIHLVPVKVSDGWTWKVERK